MVTPVPSLLCKIIYYGYYVRATLHAHVFFVITPCSVNMYFFLQIRWTALMRASDEGHDKCVQLLLEKGATLNFQSTVSLLVNNFWHVECFL